MALMDSVLRKHLQLVRSHYNKDAASINQMCETMKNIDINYCPVLGQKISDSKAVELRNQGNAFFKNGDYQNARLLYTQSLAAAIRGPLGAMAYANRCVYLFSNDS